MASLGCRKVVAETDPQTVFFQMDVLWTVLATLMKQNSRSG
jgi:hypothetical protein